MKVFIKGKGQITLDKKDFKASGGEGSIYIKGNQAYKIYNDPNDSVPTGKIQELSVLNKSYILRPLDILLDENNKNIGFTMDSINKPLALCGLFTAKAKTRFGITPDKTIKLVKKLQDGISFVHSKPNYLIVDLNEMNFVVNEDKVDEIYFIDVATYQTPNFPATALMESVRDYSTDKFTQLTDWFSFGVISFNLFVGIHPFKGKYQGIDDLETRMRRNISVLNKDVTYPSIVMPFTNIPKNYLNWYTELFEKGKRLPPPDSINEIIIVPVIHKISGSDNFTIKEIFSYDDNIINYFNGYVLTEKEIYRDKTKIANAQGKDIKLFSLPKSQTLIAAVVNNGKLELYNLSTKKNIEVFANADNILVSKDKIFIKNNDILNELCFLELNKVLPTFKLVHNIMPNSTSIYSGALVQNIIGTNHFSLFEENKCYQQVFPELKDHKIIDVKYESGILIVITNLSGVYNKFIIKYNNYKYKIREIKNISNQDINFTVLDNGICLHIHEDYLEAFSNNVEADELKQFNDPMINSSVRLYSNGIKALFSKDNKLYSFTLGK